MLRFILLSALVAIAFTERAELELKKFEPNGEYTYKFESQIVSGIPRSSEAWSGRKIRGTVKVQLTPEGTAVFKIIDCEFANTISKRIGSNDPRKILPDELFAGKLPMDSSELELMKLPITIRYRNGEIEEFKSDASDEYWSVNIKRSIVQMLQLSTERRHESPENALSERMTLGAKTFSVMEDGVTGKCESLYTVQRLPVSNYEEGRRVFNITKVKNFDNCLDRPMLNSTWFNGKSCDGCKKEACKPDTANAIFTHSEMKFDVSSPSSAPEDEPSRRVLPEDFIIEFVNAESEHRLHPFSEKAGSVVTYVDQTLRLIKSTKYSSPIALSSMKSEKRGLRLTLPYLKAVMREDGWSVMDDKDSKPEQKKQLVRELLRKISEKRVSEEKLSSVESEISNPELTPSTSLAMRVNEILLECTPTELSEITREMLAKPESDKIRSLFLDLLPTNPNPTMTKICIEAIRSGKVSSRRAQAMLTSLAMFGVGSPQSISDLVSLCETSPKPEIARTACLSAGASVNYICDTTDGAWPELKTMMCPAEYKEKIAEKFGSIFESKPSTEDRLAVLKAIGNSGLKQTLPRLITIIQGKRTYPAVIRSQAIYSMSRLSRSIPRTVERVCLPVVLDQSEHPEVRAAAYKKLMQTKPKWAIFNLIAKTIREDRSEQMKSLVISHLNSLANSTFPCCKEMTVSAQSALLRLSKPLRSSIAGSKAFHIGSNIKDLKMGALFDGSLVYSPETVLPKSGHAEFVANMFGKDVSLLEVGFHNEGLQKVLEKVFGARGSFYKKANIINLFRTTRREAVEEFEDEVEISEREPEKKIEGHFYYKLFGNELNFAAFTEDTFRTLLDSGMFKIDEETAMKLHEGYPVNYKKITTLPKSAMMVPTEYGFPLSLNLTVAAVTKSEGVLTVNRADSKSVNADADLEHSIEGEILVSMGVISPKVRSGVALRTRVQLSVPTKGSIKVDLTDVTKTKISMEMPSEERKMVHLDSTPFTFVDIATEDDSTSWKNVKIHEIKGNKVCRPMIGEYELDSKKAGLKARVNYHINSRACANYAPFHPLMGKQSLTIFVKPNEQPLKELELSMEWEKVKTEITEEIYSAYKSLSSRSPRSPVERSEERESSSERRYREEPRPEYTNWSEEMIESLKDLTERLTSEEKYYVNKYDSKESDEYKIRPSYEHKPASWEIIRDDEETSESSESFEARRSKYSSEVEDTPKSWSVKDAFMWYTKPKSELKSHVSKLATKHIIKLNIVGKTSSSSPVSLLESTTVYVHNPFASKLNIDAKRCPLMSDESSEVKYHLASAMSYPHHPIDLERRLSDEESKIHGFTKLSFGPELEKSLTLRTVVEKSPEQKYSKMSPIEDSETYRKCTKDRSEGKEFSKACIKFSLKNAELHKWTNEIEYTNIPKSLKKLASKALRSVQYMLYNKWSVEDIEERNDEGKIVIKGSLSPSRDQVDIEVRSPKETSRFRNVNLPMRIPAPSSRRSWMKVALKELTGGKLYPTCVSTGSIVETFDKLTVEDKVSEPGCEMLLAKDCSKSRLFSVTMKKLSESKKEVTIKLNLPGQKTLIKLSPDSSDKLEVIVNGAVSPIAVSEVVEIEDKTSGAPRNSPSTLKVERKSDKVVRVESPKIGLVVYSNGKSVSVLISPLHKSKMCGLCGDANSETTEERRTPSDMITDNDSDFIRSNLVNNAECKASRKPVSPLRPHRFNAERISRDFELRPVHLSSSSSLSGLVESPIKRSACKPPMPHNLIRDWFTNDGIHMMCFSKRPVKICSPQCSHAMSDEVTVPFHCMRAELPLATKWAEKISRGMNIPALASKPTTTQMPVGEDTKCFN